MNGRNRKKRGFTLIELIVVMAVLAILVLLAAPKFLGHTKEAQFTKHISNARVLEDASERYYIDHGKWPRGEEEPYTSEEVKAYADKIYDITGEEIALEDGNYWDIDYSALGTYAKLPDEDERANYVLRNPVGKIFYLEGLTEAGFERTPQIVGAKKEAVAIVDGTEVELFTGKTFNFSYTGKSQSINLPKGIYRFEVWGAQGGYKGGKGGYSAGTINIAVDTDLQVLVGGMGGTHAVTTSRTHASGGWNGGGKGYSGSSAERSYGAYLNGGGGGGTDLRVGTNPYDRIIVGGGGGGGNGANYDSGNSGGYGGGLTGQATRSNSPYSYGSQSSGGTPQWGYQSNGLFGIGGDGKGAGGAVGGGGGGWYGGTNNGGGSGYVLSETSYKPAGYTPPKEYYMTDAQLIPGNQPMPNPHGGTMTGNSGNGYARITVLELN